MLEILLDDLVDQSGGGPAWFISRPAFVEFFKMSLDSAPIAGGDRPSGVFTSRTIGIGKHVRGIGFSAGVLSFVFHATHYSKVVSCCQ